MTYNCAMDFVVNLEYNSSIPPYRRLSDALRNAILDGRLTSGQAMPSVRDLSETLHLSRSTVLKAFDDLKSQGYLETIRGSGTVVSSKLPGDLSDLICELRAARIQSMGSKRQVNLSDYGKRLLTCSTDRQQVVHVPEINYGGPTLDVAPISNWKQLMLKQCTFANIEPVAYSIEPFGYAPLREAIAAYLHRFRAVRCTADRVAVFGTKQLRLDAVARLLLNPGDCVAFEEPGYPEAREALIALGARIVPIPVDNHGIIVDALNSSPEAFKFAYVTPSHQDPLGGTLPLERRIKLIEWAKRSGALIVEDDYDSEYRYGSKPLPSLQGLDDGDCVIYFGSFWKILFQVVRFGYIVAPKRLTEPLWQVKMQLERHMPVLEQLALTDFINEGQLERYIKKSQPVFARSRQALIYALTKHMSGRLRIANESAGMHIVVSVDTDLTDEEIVLSAKEASVAIMSTDPYYLGQARRGEFLMPFSQINEDRIAANVKRWASLMVEREKVGVRQ